MSHPYLYFSLSKNYVGYAVGTSHFQAYGNGFINKDIKIIQIPRVFNKQAVTEIGNNAFYGAKITSIYIPKTIKRICYNAISYCNSLSEVRFEANSQLEIVDKNAFCGCFVVNFDIPKTVKTIDYWDPYEYFFFGVASLKCCSYLGTTDFSRHLMFHNSPIIRVSQNYPSDKFGKRSVKYKDGSTCGVSNKPFYEEIEKTFNIRRERFSHVIFFFVLILVS